MMLMNNNPLDEIWLVYDDECPVCKTYCQYVRIKEAVGKLHLIDARKPSPIMDEITAAGLDIDQGMVVKFKNTIYYGPDAIRVITLLSGNSGFFNRVNYIFFSSKLAANIFYPLGKVFRNIVLKVMGIEYIGNLKEHQK